MATTPSRSTSVRPTPNHNIDHHQDTNMNDNSNTIDSKTLLSQIQNQRQTQPLSILTLAEPILVPQPLPSQPTSTPTSSHKQNHTQPQNQPQTLTPSTLSADLTHYRDLFSKLHFSYLEQVTKEKYLRGIVGDNTIDGLDSTENTQLEEKLAVMKSELQGKKRGVEDLVTGMEGLAGELGGMYDDVERGRAELERLITEVDALEGEVKDMRTVLSERDGEVRSDDYRLNLGVEETDALLQEGKRQRDELEEQIRALEVELEGRSRECENVEGELVALERRREEVTREVIRARKVREEGGRDRLEEQGRWYVGSEKILRGLLGVEG